MQVHLKITLILCVFVGLAACAQQGLKSSSSEGNFEGFGTLDDLPTGLESDQQVVSSRPGAQLQQTGVSNFLGSNVAGELDSSAQRMALNAQFFALQFGRPGAPRLWRSAGVGGRVIVGPFVRINNLDCRDYTHIVDLPAGKRTVKGTACRDGAGNWQTANVRLS